MSIQVEVWKASGEPEGYRDATVDAMYTLDDQVSFSINPSKGGTFTYNNSTWDSVENGLYDELTLSDVDDDDSVYLAVIDDVNILSAGKLFKQAGVDSTAGSAGINGALKLWVDSTTCPDLGDSDRAYRATSIHEFGHTMDAWHSNGDIYTALSNDPTSPMLFWYAENNCGDNDPASSDCGSNTSRYGVEKLITEGTGCTKEAMEEHYNYHSL